MRTDIVVATSPAGKKRRRDFTNREHELLVALRRQGVTFKVISEQMGRSVSVLETYAAKHGIKAPPRDRRKLSKADQVKAIAMWNRGVKKVAIARHFHVSQRTINSIPGMPMRRFHENKDKVMPMPIVFSPLLKKRLDRMCKEVGIPRVRIVREALRRELDRLERERDLGANVREYGAS